MKQKRRTESRARTLEPGGLWIPPEISRIPRERLCWLGKMIAGRIYRYREKGCYESKSTLAKEFQISRSEVIRAVQQLKVTRAITFITAKGRPDCMWLRCDKKVQAEEWLYYRGKRRRNPAYTCRENPTGGAGKTQQVPVGKTLHNNKKSIRTITAASPSPADGQARRQEKEKAERRTLIQSQLRVKAVKRLPRPDFANPKLMKWRHETIRQVLRLGYELVLGGMRVDDAFEAVFNKADSIPWGKE